MSFNRTKTGRFKCKSLPEGFFFSESIWGAGSYQGTGANACDRAEDPLHALEAQFEPPKFAGVSEID